MRDTESIQANTNSQVFWERRACINSGFQAIVSPGNGLGTRLALSPRLDGMLCAHAAL